MPDDETATRSTARFSLSPEYREEGGRDQGPAADREQLAKQQAALVRALADRSGAPAGFDQTHVSTAAASLLAKRRRAIEKTWPELAASLGDRFRETFDAYARAQSIPADGPVTDGRQFAHHLRRLGQLSDGGRLQLLLSEMGRRPVGFAYLPGRREIVVALRFGRGARRFSLRCPGLRRTDFSQPLGSLVK
ncbi:MAG: hypothetical protein WBD40_03465 [Tepidisphaeraceae bacterium]